MELRIPAAAFYGQYDFITPGVGKQLLGADVYPHYQHADSQWSLAVSF